MTRTELAAWSEAKGIALSNDALDRLDRLVQLWQRYGRAINLVGGVEREGLWEHVREGLLGVALVERMAPKGARCRWVDVGSGGGLPGLVVAAVRDWEVVLIEPRERRAAFLDLGLASVGIGGGRVIRGRWGASTWNQVVAGEVEPRDETMFYALSSRAVFSAERWLREAELASVPRGIVICHVESTASGVGEKEAEAVIRDGRWGVLGFSVGNGADRR